MEGLFDGLVEVLSVPLSDPLAAENILVQNQGMARWLAQKLAERLGVAANLEFPLPASFVWRLFESQLGALPDASAYGKEVLRWRIMGLLPSLQNESVFADHDRYLRGDDAELKRYQLSGRIADLFEQYLVYRADFISWWEQGKEQHWQARLWRELRRRYPDPHRAGLLEAFRESVHREGVHVAGLPQRICLFGISAMAPVYLEVLAAVAEKIDVHLFLLNPSFNYWGDIIDEAGLARLRRRWSEAGRPDVSALYDVGNPLLASLGKQARDFIDQLNDFSVEEHELFEAPSSDHLLGLLQSDILHLQARGTPEIPVLPPLDWDDSIQLHACHSPLREVQVLHDRLLGLFERLPGLTPDQVVVMAPDMAAYAPCVEAVFGAAPGNRHIPFSIADQSDSARAPLVEMLLSWLLLPQERFEASRVLGWLELPAVQRRFGLDPGALERIRQWVAASGIRWGLDGDDRAAAGLPGGDLNSWAFGLRRLNLGYALPDGQTLFDDIAPYGNLEGNETLWLGQLQLFLERLGQWKRRFSVPVPLAGWQQRINRLIDELLLPDEAEETLLAGVREQLDLLRRQADVAGYDEPLSGRIVHEQLQAQLAASSGAQRFLVGRVTFCNMVPMRSLPFRVLCLLGMNDGEFPRTQTPLGFDLIADKPRRGDRSRRDDDRYLFLEALLSARDVLYISYLGRSQRDNSPLLPSVVVAELLDYLDQGYGPELRDRLIIEHPLQPFSPRNFHLGSYAAEWQTRDAAASAFIEAPLAATEAEAVVELDALRRFYRDPVGWFLRQRLGVEALREQQQLEDAERFGFDGLSGYQLREELLQLLLEGVPLEEARQRLAARGELPHGPFGKIAFDEQAANLEALADRVRTLQAEQQPPVEVDLPLGDVRLQGWLSQRAGGVYRYRPARLRASDRLLLWVEHLALCAVGAAGESRYLTKEGEYRLTPLSEADALGGLTTLLDLYRQGQDVPLPIFPESALRYAQQRHKGKSPEEALATATPLWEGGPYAAAEGDRPLYRLAFRGRKPLAAPFGSLAEQLFLPLLAAEADD